MKKNIVNLVLFFLMSIVGFSQSYFFTDDIEFDITEYQIFDLTVSLSGNEQESVVEESILLFEMGASIDELFSGVEASSGDKVTDCKYKNVSLYGKVKVVNSFPDFKVKIVESFPDLKVKIVESFPDSCGKWKMVDSFPDFTIQFVDSFPDFTVKMVESFPGMP